MLTSGILLMLNGLFFSLRLGQNGSFPRPLKEDEERFYLERSAQGDMEARNKLIEHNLRLVAHIIKKYYTQAGDQDDLISIGTIGLIKGISTFKPDKNVRLATYASRCVENAILSQRISGVCGDSIYSRMGVYADKGPNTHLLGVAAIENASSLSYIIIKGIRMTLLRIPFMWIRTA